MRDHVSYLPNLPLWAADRVVSTMSLFEVKGWDVAPQAGMVGSTSQPSKKRKRLANDLDKVQLAQVNVEKLMRKVEKGDIWSRNEQKKERRNGQRAKGIDSIRTSDDHGTKLPGKEARVKARTKKSRKGEMRSMDKNSSNTINPPPSKRAKKKGSGISSPSRLQHATNDAPSPEHKRKRVQSTEPSIGLTSLQASMKGSLDGARFRCSQSPGSFAF